MRKQAGFTLIELVVVLVLLGILGAVATAQFQDLSGEARQAALEGISAEIQSGSALNYAKGVVQDPPSFSVSVTDGDDCETTMGSLLSAGQLPDGWQIAGGTATSISGCGASGATMTSCQIEDTGQTVGPTTNLTLICTG
jgi:MSHA pilin protein MshA